MLIVLYLFCVRAWQSVILLQWWQEICLHEGEHGGEIRMNLISSSKPMQIKQKEYLHAGPLLQFSTTGEQTLVYYLARVRLHVRWLIIGWLFNLLPAEHWASSFGMGKVSRPCSAVTQQLIVCSWSKTSMVSLLFNHHLGLNCCKTASSP